MPGEGVDENQGSLEEVPNANAFLMHQHNIEGRIGTRTLGLQVDVSKA